MDIIEGAYSHHGVEVKYKYRRATSDRHGLTVVFSGFRELGTYDFDGEPAADLQGNILWILDEFEGNFSYYLCIDMDFRVERAIAALLEESIKYLGITRNDCSVMGFSKGATAAIYYGIKYNLGAIIATVPQSRIGSYVEKYWPAVFESMTHDGSAAECAFLDSLLLATLQGDREYARSIYLFSSRSDPQHDREIEPLLPELKKYANFSYILTASPLVTNHSAVTRYNVPLLVSLAAMLSEGAKPILGTLVNGSLAPRNANSTLSLAEVQSREDVVRGFTSLEFREAKMLPEGYAFVKGYPADAYGCVRTVLRISNASYVQDVPLGGVIDATLSTRFYENQFCDYSVGKFATQAHRGIDLAELPSGKFDLSIEVKHGGVRRVVAGRSDKARISWTVAGGYFYKVEADDSSASLTKRPAVGPKAAGAYFEPAGSWARGSKVHFEGYFAVEGIPVPRYEDVQYFLVLSPVGGQDPVAAVPMASDQRADIQDRLHDPWLDYSKAYFASPRYQGIGIGSVPPGKYLPSITARFGDSVFTESFPGVLEISGSFPGMQRTSRVSVGVVGSCVSRDNLNSRLSPGWKEYFRLEDVHYQSSFLSLLSQPVVVDVSELETEDLHATRVNERDFSKDYLLGLAGGDAPDVLIIDFFTDARFGCVHIGGSLVTNNAWKLYETSYWRSLPEPRKFTMIDSETAYLSAFRSAAERFNELRMQHFPNTKIVLNRARAVYGYIDKGTKVQFSRKSVDQINERWQLLDDVFLSCVPALVVDVDTSETLSDATHPWGPAPYHYERAFYAEFRKLLLTALGYEPQALLTGPQENG